MQIQSRSLGGLCLALSTLLLFAPALSAQDDAPSPDAPPAPGQAPPQAQQGPPAVPDSIQELMQEFQGLQQQLASLQSQAMEQSDELQEQRADVEETIQEAMLEHDPELEADMERMEELQEEMQAAQEARDQQRMMSLSQEAGSLRRELQTAQAEVMEEPRIQDAIESFQDDLLEEMVAINPQAEEMIAQLEELGERFQEFQESQSGSASQGPPPAGAPPGR